MPALRDPSQFAIALKAWPLEAMLGVALLCAAAALVVPDVSEVFPPRARAPNEAEAGENGPEPAENAAAAAPGPALAAPPLVGIDELRAPGVPPRLAAFATASARFVVSMVPPLAVLSVVFFLHHQEWISKYVALALLYDIVGERATNTGASMRRGVVLTALFGAVFAWAALRIVQRMGVGAAAALRYPDATPTAGEVLQTVLTVDLAARYAARALVVLMLAAALARTGKRRSAAVDDDDEEEDEDGTAEAKEQEIVRTQEKRAAAVYSIVSLYRALVPLPLWVAYISASGASGSVFEAVGGDGGAGDGDGDGDGDGNTTASTGPAHLALVAAYLSFKVMYLALHAMRSRDDLAKALRPPRERPRYGALGQFEDPAVAAEEGNAGAGAAAGNACSICLGERQAGQPALVLPCNHRFDRACLERWFERQAGGAAPPTCPLCREAVPENPENELAGLNPVAAARVARARWLAANARNVLPPVSVPVLF